MAGLTIGVLTLQGGFDKHMQTLEKLGVNPVKVREAGELNAIDGLIIPGGESTTIIRLLRNFGIYDRLREKILQGLPVFGTCAGMILLSRGIDSHPEQETLGLMDYRVSRNDYGRQIDSFDAKLIIKGLGDDPVPAVFIRAPRITEIGSTAEVLSEYEDSPVLVRQGHMLAASFHPELTEDIRVHKLFLSMIEG
ncbi:pyridoxal 5'-phosphate synthase glutaminase subunit PdxT [Spirochaeta isovalerica]|uniref:Pyridoxal 5'-phosphate synthase subunit PdxT n=1 Tax=Spirochaeta isovalerica TaxID=150 RepID=A0A841R109_9SPIO|nr:pyridoxal 5'-phosphate synthase glutaminase subunit PdxT [Spirochaeta isovalerica]MBB6478644.1 5'-phosphate synthase pdxT subunit [Spirochaeta isovalerica]